MSNPSKTWILGLLGLLLLAGQVNAYEIYSAKKGVASGDAAKIQALNPSWYYNWNIQRVPGIDPAVEYVPMKHNRWWRHESELANIGEFKHYLGFNEPERVPPQGDITVDQAIAQWPNIENAVELYGDEVLMGSPATANPEHPWIIDFMNKAQSQGLQVDFMAMHKYPPPTNSSEILNGAQWYHETYNRDVWITEFNAADWSAPNNYTQERTYSWLVEVLFRLESTSYIKRYAIFPWYGNHSSSQASPTFEVDEKGNGTNVLTPLGKLYAEYRANDIAGPYTQTWYYLHNKGGNARLLRGQGNPSTTHIYREGGPVEFELLNAGGGKIYIANRGTGEYLASNGTSTYWTASETGSPVQWTWTLPTTNAYNWVHLVHSGSGNYLYRISNGNLGLRSSALNDGDRWTFIRSGTPYGVTGNNPPIFNIDPIKQSNAVENQAYSGTVSGSAADGDADPLTYVLVSGPAWLKVAPGGALYGTPGAADVGQNTWTVQVSDGKGDTDTATLNIAVDLVNGNILPMAGSTAGAEEASNPANLSHDGNEGTRWASDGILANAWIEYDLGAYYKLGQVSLLLHSGLSRTYPIRIEVDGVTVFTGNTTPSNGYWSAQLPHTIGRTVRITMTAPNSQSNSFFSIYEAVFNGWVAEIQIPRLNISLSGNYLNLSWPAEFIGWRLEYKTDLQNTTDWIPLPIDESTNTFHVDFSPGTPLFFRLKK